MRVSPARAIGKWCRFLAVTGVLATVATSEVAGQALTGMRDWTSSDGKVMQAELLVFQPGADNSIVRLRSKDGSVFKLDLSRFRREDQALILKERLKSQFRVDLREEKGNCFFYSRQLAADDWRDRTWAYFGSDTETSWLRLAIYAKPEFFSKGVAIIVIGEGLPLRIPYDSDEVDRKRRGRISSEGIDIALGEQSDDFVRVLKNPDRLQFFLEIPGADHRPISLGEKEKRGLREVGEAFETVAALSTDKTWWATVIDRDREVLIAEEADRLREFRDPEREPIIPMRTWTNALGKSIEAAVLGFAGPDAVLRDTVGELTAVAATNFVVDDLEALAIRRLELELLRGWHPVDDRFDYYWPIAWENDRRFRHQAVLFAVDRKTREPRLVLQQVFEGDPELEPVSVELRGPEMPGGLKIPLADPVKVRSGSGVKVWLPLERNIAEVLLGLLPEIEGMDFVLTTRAEGEMPKGTLREDEFAASVEAAEIYRMFDRWRALAAEASPVEPPAAVPSSDSSGAGPAAESPPSPETEPAKEPEPSPEAGGSVP